jgi:DNA-binding NtrC family response regulator
MERKRSTCCGESPTAFSVLLTDIRMPGAHDGWAVARAARERDSSIPVIYMTGDSEALHAKNGVKDSLLLSKPFTLGHIVRVISRILDLPMSGQAVGR